MDIELFKSIPANSVTALPEQTRLAYLEDILSMPEKVQDILFSDSTGAYLQGLTKSLHMPPENAQKIALAILEVAIKKKEISELATSLSQDLGIPLDDGLKIASEIDQDLFAPIQDELDAFWAGESSSQNPKSTDSLPQKTAPQESTPTRTPNVLDLKELSARPEQKDLPARPVQRKLMPGNRIVDLSQRPTLNPSNPVRSEKSIRSTPTPPPMPPKRQFPLPPTNRP